LRLGQAKNKLDIYIISIECQLHHNFGTKS
jgi:hypothetical protein